MAMATGALTGRLLQSGIQKGAPSKRGPWKIKISPPKIEFPPWSDPDAAAAGAAAAAAYAPASAAALVFTTAVAVVTTVAAAEAAAPAAAFV